MTNIEIEQVDLNQVRERIVDMIDIAEQRCLSFFEVQSIFKSIKNSLSGKSFNHLKVKLGNEYDINKLTLLYDRLSELIDSHICFDDKLIFVIKHDDILKSLDEFVNSNDGSYQIFKKRQLTNDCICYQFSVTREMNIRVKLNPSDLKDEFNEYQEIYAIEKIPLTCHDFVMINKSRIIVGIDLASVLGANELNIAENNFFNFLKKEVRLDFKDKVNFFPKIRAFYDLPKDGSNGVTDISFITTAGTAHHEILRGNATDVRTATYHEAGIQGVRGEKFNGQLLNNDITPYKISTRFYRMDKNDLDIAIKSSYRAIGNPNVCVYGAFIYGGRNIADFDFAISHLMD